jgi:hypothetical protein
VESGGDGRRAAVADAAAVSHRHRHRRRRVKSVTSTRGGGSGGWAADAVEAVGTMVTSILSVGADPVSISATQNRRDAAPLSVR